MATCSDLKILANNRVKVSRFLYKKADYIGVVDNIGFALELALKAAICKRLNILHYPDQAWVTSGNPQYSSQKDIVNFFRTHDFVILSLLAGVSSYLTPDTNNSASLNKNWGDITTTWSPDVRYNPPATYDQQTAKRMIEAATDKNDGVITFIKRKWR